MKQKYCFQRSSLRGSLAFACLLTPLLLIVLSATARADITKSEANDENGRPVTVYRLVVTPAKEPSPAMKYRFTVEPHQTIAGNAITHYLRSLGENSLNAPLDAAREKFGTEFHEWYRLETKQADVPVEELREVAGSFDSYAKHLHRATLCREADWGLALEDVRGRDLLEFTLPSVQQTRSMARVLSLRHRLAVIDRRFDDAVEHLRMTYQLGQNVSTMPMLVTQLVALAEIGMANESALDLIAAEGSPNLYWAFAELPRPIINLRDSMRLEVSNGLRYFPELLKVETADHSPAEWRRQLTQLFSLLEEVQSQYYSGPRADDFYVPAELLGVSMGIATYPAAKQRLIDAGMDAATVDAMPVAQVILIDTKREYERLSNLVERSLYLPADKFAAALAEVDRELRKSTTIGRQFAGVFLPAMAQVRYAQIRIEGQINALLTIEAIRDHLAASGSFPQTLDELSLPAFDNPATGEPFGYRLEGDTAILDVSLHQYRYWFELKLAAD